jgi:hypothetical protein
MDLTKRQLETKDKIVKIATVLESLGFSINPIWAISIAMVESSLGEYQKSPTGCRGVFQMSGIAMKDLLQEMEKTDDDITDIICGLAFLHLLFKRYKTIEAATAKFCDPNDRGFYVSKVINYMETFKEVIV